MSGQILSLLAGMVRVAIPISFAALAGMLSERAGVINMGLEGIMLIGSFFAVVGSYVTGNAWMGLLFAALSGILMGLVLVTLTVGFKCEHVLAGVGINIFASGITIVLLEMIFLCHSIFFPNFRMQTQRILVFLHSSHLLLFFPSFSFVLIPPHYLQSHP